MHNLRLSIIPPTGEGPLLVCSFYAPGNRGSERLSGIACGHEAGEPWSRDSGPGLSDSKGHAPTSTPCTLCVQL